MGNGVGTVREEQRTTKESYTLAMKNIILKVGDLSTSIRRHKNRVLYFEREVPQTQLVVELEEAIKKVSLDEIEISRVVKIGGSLEKGVLKALIIFLKENKDVFA